MTPDDLRTAAGLLFGSERFGFGWVRPLARVLGVDERTVRRWKTGQVEIPAGVANRMIALAKVRESEVRRLQVILALSGAPQ